MVFFRKLFRTEHVYAGPEPVQKEKKQDFEMADVYAGPEQMGMLSHYISNPEKDEKKKTKNKRIPPEREYFENPVQAVYAAPDISELTKVQENPEEMKPYPLNNAPEAEIIICPECGEKTHHGRFCECCGTILK